MFKAQKLIRQGRKLVAVVAGGCQGKAMGSYSSLSLSVGLKDFLSQNENNSFGT